MFVDGCFWHRCPQHFVAPKRNAGWWAEKIAATVDRDERQAAGLRDLGWRVLRVWEHDLSPSALPATVERLGRAAAERT